LVWDATVNFVSKEANKFTVEHSVYVGNDFHGKGIVEVILSELIVLAKQQGLHTMMELLMPKPK
jgi:phosphinothricin acetyltransferase